MPYDRRKYTLETPIPFKENAEVAIDLPKTGYITHIDLLLHVKGGSADGTNPPSPLQDDLLRLVKAVRIVSGGTPFLELPARWAWIIAYYMYPKAPRKDSLPSDTSHIDMYAFIPLHFGMVYATKFDPTAVVPAKELSSLKLSVLWGSASDVAGNFAIDAADLTVTIYELASKPSDVAPKIIYSDTEIPAAFSGYGFKVGIQNDMLIHRLFVVQTDGTPAETANRTNAVVTAVKLRDEYANYDIFKMLWSVIQEGDRIEYNKDPLDGVAIIDPSEAVGKPLWYTGVRTNTYTLNLTTTGAGGLSLVYLGFQKV